MTTYTFLFSPKKKRDKDFRFGSDKTIRSELFKPRMIERTPEALVVIFSGLYLDNFCESLFFVSSGILNLILNKKF
jgi:hypothetical protein